MLILASASRYRRQLLERLGVPFVAEAHRVDESTCDERDPDRRVATLARRKAESLRDAHPQGTIIGSDQIVVLGQRVIGKPGSAEVAREQLRALSGTTHRLLTAVCVAPPDGPSRAALDEHRLTMRALSDDEISRYVAADEPLDCCGSYKIESLGIALLDRLEGDDFTAITGLPLVRLSQILRELGWSVP